MAKKYAFIVIQKSPRRMVLLRVNNCINAIVVESNLEVGTA
jgi:hypothetical protein